MKNIRETTSVIALGSVTEERDAVKAAFQEVQSSFEMLWCTEAEEHGFLPWFVDLQAARTDSWRPRSSIRLRTVTAIRVSTFWAGRVCERKVSPMMRLYRLIAPSAPALAL